jgi:hypothetical protein
MSDTLLVMPDGIFLLMDLYYVSSFYSDREFSKSIPRLCIDMCRKHESVAKALDKHFKHITDNYRHLGSFADPFIEELRVINETVSIR